MPLRKFNTLMRKTLSKLGREWNLLNLRKGICEKPTVNVTLSGECVPPKIRNKEKNLLL